MKASEEWVRDRYTQRARDSFEKQLEAARVKLKSVCLRSTDPEVRAAQANCDTLEIVVRFMSGKEDGNGNG